jgi:glycosidase
LQFAPQKEHPFGRPRSDELAFDRDLHAFYRAAIALRHRRSELRRGVITPAHSDDTGNTYGFTRTLAGATTHVLFNRSEETRKIVLAGAASATNVLFTTTPGGGGVEVTATGGDLTVTLPRLTGAVVSPAP